MWYKYEVYSWVKNPLSTEDNVMYQYVEVYRGESLLKALFVMVMQRRIGVSCVKLEWR